MCSLVAIAALDAIWSLNNSRLCLLPQGTHLWHGGIIGPQAPLDNSKGLWVTIDSGRKDRYNGWAKADAIRNGKTPFLREFEAVKDLQLAHFNRASLKQFTEDFCKSQHDLMKSTVIAWICSRGLDGIISINGNDDEVVVCRPVDDLKQVGETQL